MCKDDENLDGTASDTPKKVKTLPAAMEQYKYTSETAKEASKRAAYCRSLRAQMRKKLLEAAVDAGIDRIYAKALKSGDIDAMTVAREGMKLVGLDFASSEESVQRTESKIDAKTDNKVEVVVKGLDG